MRAASSGSRARDIAPDTTHAETRRSRGSSSVRCSRSRQSLLYTNERIQIRIAFGLGQGRADGCPPLRIRVYQQRIHRIPVSNEQRWHPLGHWIARSLCRSLLLLWHQAYLLQHAHEIVKEILFHDLAMFVPPRNSTEIHVEALIRGLYHHPAWHRHRTRHGSPEIRHSARPFVLGQHDLVWIVDEMLVRKRLEECNRFLFVGVYAMGGRLIRPAHDAILRVIFPKYLQVLSVPRIIQLLHILEICCSIHSAPRGLCI